MYIYIAFDRKVENQKYCSPDILTVILLFLITSTNTVQCQLLRVYRTTVERKKTKCHNFFIVLIIVLVSLGLKTWTAYRKGDRSQ